MKVFARSTFFRSFFRAAGIWVVTIVGIWLLGLSPAYATSTQDCHFSRANFLSSHFLSSSGLTPQVVTSHLPAAYLLQLKENFLIGDSFSLSSRPLSSRSDRYTAATSHAGLETWTQAIANDPNNPMAWNNLGQSLFAQEQYEKALVAYDHALLIKPTHSLALANRCGVLSQLAHYDQALTSCDLALDGDGQWGVIGSALAWNNRGDVLFNLEQYQASLRSFEKALLVKPDLQTAWHNRAVVLSQLENLENVSDVGSH